jgi:DNA-binding CsgD family transcriptional regulator
MSDRDEFDDQKASTKADDRTPGGIVTAVSGWEDCDVGALEHVVRHGRRGYSLTPALLEDLRRVVEADYVALLERLERADPSDSITVLTPARPEKCAGSEDVWSHVWASEVCDADDSDDGCSADHVHRAEVANVAGARHPLANSSIMLAPMRTPLGQARLALIRHYRDFDERDQLLLALLRPHLVAAYRRGAERRTAGKALTARQRTVLQLVARGWSNDEIARALLVSKGTVRKHLDNAYRQLGVSSRAAAVARAFPDGVDSEAGPRPRPRPGGRTPVLDGRYSSEPAKLA